MPTMRTRDCRNNAGKVSWVFLLLLLPTVTTGLANRMPDFKEQTNPALDFVKNVVLGGTDEQSPDPGDALLKELNLSSSTEPKRFYARPQQLPALLAASMPTIFRLASGVFCNGYKVSIEARNKDKYTIAPFFGKDYQVEETATILPKFIPSQALILYEYESCIECRKVREAMSMLSLKVTFRPCPIKGTRYRREIAGKYGDTFPVLMDPNTSIELLGADAIIDYLFRTYANGVIPWTLDNPLLEFGGSLGLALSGGRLAKPCNPPALPLVLWGYEGSPFCKLVRERLTELELEHTQISCPRGCWNRQELFQLEQGRFQVPFLQDPNTGVSLYESEAIVEYVTKLYAVTPTPVKYL